MLSDSVRAELVSVHLEAAKDRDEGLLFCANARIEAARLTIFLSGLSWEDTDVADREATEIVNDFNEEMRRLNV